MGALSSKAMSFIKQPMCRLFPLLALFLALSASTEINPEWTPPPPPFQIADNLYFVGTQDLAAYLVTTPADNILINANLETSPPQAARACKDSPRGRLLSGWSG